MTSDEMNDVNMVKMRSPVRLWLRAPHYKAHLEKSAKIMQQPTKNELRKGFPCFTAKANSKLQLQLKPYRR